VTRGVQARIDAPPSPAGRERARGGPALLPRVQALIAERLGQALGPVDGLSDAAALFPGKMLRTRLAGRILADGPLGSTGFQPVPLGSTGFQPVPPGTGSEENRLQTCSTKTIELACAATELVHTASLCHDDVIDGAVIRRAIPTLWRATSPSAAVLIGDLLLCEAIDLITTADGGRLTGAFIRKMRQTCQAETEQELLLRGASVSEETCLRLARGKTGALFAFVAQICGGADAALLAALEEAGYRVGAAYQVADDLLDAIGREESAGKTLGTDAARHKVTLVTAGPDGQARARRHVKTLCRGALDCLAPWPAARNGVEEFLSHDLLPLLEQQGLTMDLA
jgi:geranylgeranyl pyrophosphate synthase